MKYTLHKQTNTMKKIILAVALLMPACAANQTRLEKKAEFKFIMQDVCVDTEDEIILAQHLYNSIVNK